MIFAFVFNQKKGGKCDNSGNVKTAKVYSDTNLWGKKVTFQKLFHYHNILIKINYLTELK